MPLHLKQATLTLFKQLAYTIFFAVIFAASDYVSNHDQINLSQLLDALILPVSLAVLNTIETFYQTRGDLAVVEAVDQLKPRIQFLEQRLFLQQPQPEVAQVPLMPAQPVKQPPSPIAPKFTAPQVAGGPLFVQPPTTGRPTGPDAPFSLIDKEMEDNIARLSSFPFQQGGKPS
jgi:hypothetical protein